MNASISQQTTSLHSDLRVVGSLNGRIQYAVTPSEYGVDYAQIDPSKTWPLCMEQSELKNYKSIKSIQYATCVTFSAHLGIFNSQLWCTGDRVISQCPMINIFKRVRNAKPQDVVDSEKALELCLKEVDSSLLPESDFARERCRFVQTLAYSDISKMWMYMADHARKFHGAQMAEWVRAADHISNAFKTNETVEPQEVNPVFAPQHSSGIPRSTSNYPIRHSNWRVAGAQKENGTEVIKYRETHTLEAQITNKNMFENLRGKTLHSKTIAIDDVMVQVWEHDGTFYAPCPIGIVYKVPDDVKKTSSHLRKSKHQEKPNLYRVVEEKLVEGHAMNPCIHVSSGSTLKSLSAQLHIHFFQYHGPQLTCWEEETLHPTNNHEIFKSAAQQLPSPRASSSSNTTMDPNSFFALPNAHPSQGMPQALFSENFNTLEPPRLFGLHDPSIGAPHHDHSIDYSESEFHDLLTGILSS